MSVHRYRLGQTVSVSGALPGHPPTTRAEIVRLMPASVDGEFHYRVRGADKVERAVSESRLSATMLI